MLSSFLYSRVLVKFSDRADPAISSSFKKKKKKKKERKNKNKPVRLPYLSEKTDPDLHQRRRQATSESGFAISIFLPSLTSISALIISWEDNF